MTPTSQAMVALKIIVSIRFIRNPTHLPNVKKKYVPVGEELAAEARDKGGGQRVRGRARRGLAEVREREASLGVPRQK